MKFCKAISSMMRKSSNSFDISGRFVTVVTYDQSSQVHKFLEKIIRRSYLSVSHVPPTIIYKSLPRVMELLCSKRRDIAKIRAHLEQVMDL